MFPVRLCSLSPQLRTDAIRSRREVEQAFRRMVTTVRRRMRLGVPATATVGSSEDLHFGEGT